MTWWRRQRLPLLALLITAAAAVGVHLWFDAAPYAEREEPAYIVADGPVEIGGHDLALTSARWDEYTAPAGSVTLSVRLEARSGTDAEMCGAFLLSEVDGDRSWHDAHRDLEVPYDAGESSCQTESPAYGILAVFLLPEDATGPFWLDIPAGDEIARFRVSP